MNEMNFFVYGSMSEGFVHFSKIKDFVSSSESAKIQASAYRLKVGFPVVIEGGTDAVEGQLVRLRATDLLAALLDEFHGVNSSMPPKSLYFRKEVEVITATGREMAWVYFLNPVKLPAQSVKIPGGDWKTVLREQPTLTEKLTERQRTYVLRLGSITGREIVPIDLPLYRELMNLELIVDKGRRLALSKLGQEVFRYLS
jgi:gamma-glutamylcyclotransferase (GGCT)/AIG2-like uncharacterized protein YtfP